MGDYKAAEQEFNDAYDQAYSHWSNYLVEAETDVKFKLGDQWTYKDKRKLKKAGRDPWVFNKTLRNVRLIGGYQRKNRLVLKVDPIEGSDDATANQLTGCLMWIMQPGGYQILSDAFEKGPLTSGINLINVYVDYTEDPVNGDIKLKRIPHDRFLLDPCTFSMDLSDCTFLLRREYFQKKMLKVLLPKHAARIDAMTGGKDGKFHLYNPPIDINGEKYLRYDEMWVRNYKPIKTLLDPKTGAWTYYDKSPEMLKKLKQAFPFLVVLDGYKKTVELRILVEGKALYVGPDPNKLDTYPYVPFVGLWTPEAKKSSEKIQSVTRWSRDPNYEINRRRLKILDIMDTRISSGWKAEEDSVVSKDSLYQTGQNKVVWTKAGKFEKVQALEMGDIPQGLFRLCELLDRDVIEIPGANEEMFGAPQNNDIRQAGILSKLRQAAGLTVLQDLFDNYRSGKVLVGRLIVQLIQNCFTPAKVKRIINEEPTKEFYDKKFGKYDCVPTEGVLSDTQRQMYYAELRSMQTDGAPIPWSAIIDAAPLQWKNKLSEFMKQQEAEGQKEAQFQKLMEQLTVALMQAKTAEDIAAAREKTTQAMENRANAALDRVKAAKEIGQMDFNELMEIMKFIFELEHAGKEQSTPKKSVTKR